MKASAIPYGGILLILIITSIVIAYIIGGIEPVSRNIVTLEGNLMTFGNEVDLFTKMYDQSIVFISQRAAYDIGKSGGLEKDGYWTSTYPSTDDLKNSLGVSIEGRLPSSSVSSGIDVSFGSSDVKISSNATCSVNCFVVDGFQNIIFRDETIKASVSQHHALSSQVSSSYFSLVNAGRFIAERPVSDFQSSAAFSNFQSAFKSNFPSIDMTPQKITDYVQFMLEDESCLSKSQYYCIAPLKVGETGITLNGKQIPYDYLKLKLKIKVENAVVPECVPHCSGKSCGSDDCGGSCGSCTVGTCISGQCESACIPDCTGKVCGSDGCGGSCGTCSSGVCDSNGQCPCTPNCAGKNCGSDGCGGSCGTCSGTCNNGVCQPSCTPNCVGKSCGSDGCGGTCLPGCSTNQVCNNGICQTTCSSINGVCELSSACINVEDGHCNTNRYECTASQQCCCLIP